MARRAWIGGALAILLFGAWKMVPWLTTERAVVAGSPSLGGLVSASSAPLKKGARACISPVPLEPTARRIAVWASARRKPVPLRITITAPGYSTSVRVPANWPSTPGAQVVARLPEPPPRALVGRVCIANLGDRGVDLVGTDEPRSQVRAESTIDGRPVTELALELYGDNASVISRVGTLIDRAALLTSIVPTFVAWIVAILFVVGVPAGAIAALALSMRSSEIESRRS